ncbi:MAG: ABC transporter substrate-binding protein [Deltaproteobacteria bacterium]|nr:ABC transporter substrate-binding protein [Deltaproteobacteria bacterium]
MKNYSLPVLLALAIFFSPAYGDDDLRSVAEGAKREGSLTLYMSAQVTDIQRLLEGFRRHYPFAKTEFIPLTGERLLARIITETSARRYSADVYRLDLLRVQELLKRSLLEKYTPPEAARYPRELRDPEGRWTGHALTLEVMGWNTKLLPKELVPKKFDDLLRPGLKGKIAIESTTWDWFTAVQELMGGEEKGLAFMRALAAQKPTLRRGHTLLSQLVAAGEDPLAATLHSNGIETLRLRGAPVDWTWTDPVLSKVQIIGVAGKAPHPNMARLFVNFALSREGQTILGDVGRTPADPEVVPSLSSRLSIKGKRLFVYPPEWGERGNELRERFEEVLGKN